MIETYPKSPRSQVARYHRATLRHGLAKTVPGGAPQETWESVADGLKRFCERHPESWRTGDAAVQWTEVALERMFDRDRAAEAADVAVEWAKRTRDRKNEKNEPEAQPAWYRADGTPRFARLKPVIYRCYARAGLVAYLGGDKERAAKLLKMARRFENSERKQAGVETGMDRMMSIAGGSMDPLTPEELLEEIPSETQKTCLQLGDLALLTFRPGRAQKLYERLLSGERPFGVPSSGMKCYLLLRMGQAFKFQGEHETAMSYLKELYRPDLRKHRWARRGILRVGIWTQNKTQDMESGLPHYKYVFSHWPEADDAELALYYYGYFSARAGKHRQAVEAFEKYLRRYPDQHSYRQVKNELLPKSRAQLEGAGR